MKHLMIVVACAFVMLESSAAICKGCKTRSNPGARYCSNCGKKMPSPETLGEKCEALLRGAMPTGSLQTTAKKSESDEESFLLARKGRNLVIAVIAANAEREAAGLSSVWPRSADSLSEDKDDISGVLFKNSTDYFRELLDMKNIGKGSWEPYVSNVDCQIAIPKGASRAQWIVARGVTDEVANNVPVLVSSNVDPTSLVSAPGRHSGNRLDGALRFSGEWAVVVRKDGDTIVVMPKRASLSLIYKNQDFILPKGFGYLEP